MGLFKKGDTTMGIMKINGIGGVTKQPELRTVQTAKGAQSVCNLNLAFDSGRKDDQGNPISQFIQTTVWGKSAEYVCAHVQKGTRVYIEGVFAGDITSTGSDGTVYHNLVVDFPRIEVPNVSSSANQQNQTPPPAPAPTQQTPPPTPAPAPTPAPTPVEQTPPPVPDNQGFIPVEAADDVLPF